MKESTLTLPRMKLECLRCRHTWKQAVPRWDRGHLLMKREDRTVFVTDDLGHELGESIQGVVAPLLRRIGFSDFSAEACPQCGHGNARVVRGLLAPSTYGSEDLACAFLLEEDFIKVGLNWQLRPEAIETLTCLEEG
jgi:hypothetical protein